MSSTLRIESSRANGAKSLGPVTPEGKARVSQNAMRHGLLSQAVVLPDECPETFEEVLTAFREELMPQTHLENEYVDAIAVASWRRRRVWHIEGAEYAKAVHAQPPIENPEDAENPAMRTTLAFNSLCKENLLGKLNRYEARFSREVTRHVLLLNAYRKISKQT